MPQNTPPSFSPFVCIKGGYIFSIVVVEVPVIAFTPCVFRPCRQCHSWCRRQSTGATTDILCYHWGSISFIFLCIALYACLTQYDYHVCLITLYMWLTFLAMGHSQQNKIFYKSSLCKTNVNLVLLRYTFI